MELIDVLDEKGNATGEKKTIQQLHKDNNIHRAVHIWLINDKNEVLLQLRSPRMVRHPNKWHMSSAGHIDADENAIEGAIRELKEELGIDCKSEELEYLFTIDYSTRIENREFQEVFLVKCNKQIKEFILQEEEVSEIKWVEYKEFKEMVKNEVSNLVIHRDEYNQLFKKLDKRINL